MELAWEVLIASIRYIFLMVTFSIFAFVLIAGASYLWVQHKTLDRLKRISPRDKDDLL